MPALYTMTNKFEKSSKLPEELMKKQYLKKTEYDSVFLILLRLIVRPKMKVRRSLRRGAVPLKKDQI